MKDQAESLRQLVRRRLPQTSRTIAITSGKGGVGKTNISVNLALSLVRLNKKVALLDADLGLANADIVLGVYPNYNLTHVLQGEKEIKNIILEGPLGLHVLAGGSGVYDLANLGQWQLERFIRSMEQLDQEYDFLIIDTGAGIHRSVLSFVLSVDEVIVVTTPEPTSITDAYGMVKTIIQRTPETNIRVLVNMAAIPRDGEIVFQKLNTVVKQFLNRNILYGGYILRDPNVARSVLEQEPFVLAYPVSSATRSIERVAHTLIGDEVDTKSQQKGIRSFFSKMYNYTIRK